MKVRYFYLAATCNYVKVIYDKADTNLEEVLFIYYDHNGKRQTSFIAELSDYAGYNPIERYLTDLANIEGFCCHEISAKFWPYII